MGHSDDRNPDAQTEALAVVTRTVVDAGGDPENPRTRRQLLRIAGGVVAGGAALAIAGAKPAAAANGDPVLIGQSNTGTVVTLLGNTTVGETSDLKLSGTGRLSQINSAGTTGGAKPTADPIAYDLARGGSHEVWASSAETAWKRLNAVRVDTASGSGAPFAPIRLVDTRSAIGGVQGPIATNVANNFNARTPATIPDDTIAIFCNVTAVSPTYSGWLTVYPQGATLPGVSNVNFLAGQVVANFVVVGLSSTGQFTIRPGVGGGPSGTVDFIVDIFAYVQ